MDTAKDDLRDAVLTVADWMKYRGIALPSELADHLASLKTQGGWERILWDDVREFYANDQDVSQFLDSMITTIESQLTRAWNEGMRNNGLDPVRDMTPEFEAELQSIIDQEFNHVLDFAQAIEDARAAGTPVNALKPRVELWANRYPDVVNQAMVFTKPEDTYAWVMGATEEHCATCAALDGWVATGKEWDESGYHPQQPPNGALECGGWRCDCSLQRVDARSMGVPRV